METENQQVVPKRGFLTKKRLLTLLLIALLASGVWWFTSPRALYQVATIEVSPGTDANAPVMINEAGFLLKETAGTIGLYDGTGRRRWSVDPAHADPGYQIQPTLPNSDNRLRFALTRDGRDFAIICPWHNRFHIQTWHEGKLIGDLLLPLGQCGDASGIIRSFEFTETGRLALTIFAARARVSLPQSVDIVVENGQFSAHYSAGTQNLQPNSAWSAKEVVPQHKYQVIHSTSGKAWTFATPFVNKKLTGTWERCTVSPSGKYAVVTRDANRVIQPFWDSLVSLCPSLNSLNKTGGCRYYYVYTRPGRMCAMMCGADTLSSSYWSLAYISYDGHSILAGPMPDKMAQPVYKLYRW